MYGPDKKQPIGQNNISEMMSSRHIEDITTLLPAELSDVLEEKINLGQTLITQLASPR